MRSKLITGILIFVILLSFIYSNFVLKLPYKSTEDVWHYLASVHELRRDFSQVNDPYFIDGPKDVHYGPYFLGISILTEISNLNVYNAYLLISVVNSCFVIFSLYFFYRSLKKDRNISMAEAISFVFICLFLWGPNTLSFSGYYSFSDLLLNGGAPANFALGMVFCTLGVILRSEKYNIALFTLILFLSFLTFLSHILTGVMLFFLIYIYVFSKFLEKRRITKKLSTLVLIPPISFALSLTWGYYSIFDFFFHKTKFVNSADAGTPFGINIWALTGLLGVVFLIFVPKTKNLFLISWSIFFSIVLLSCLLPFKVSLYWRFFPLMIIPGFIALNHYIFGRFPHSKLVRKITVFFIACGLIFSFHKFSYRATWTSFTLERWPELASLNTSDVVLSDPSTSHVVAGLYGVNIVATKIGQRNPLNEGESFNRETDINNLLRNHVTLDQMKEILNKYSVTYILITRKSYPYDWFDYEPYFASNYENISTGSDYAVYKINSHEY